MLDTDTVTTLTSESLPLSVREHLMRGQTEQAISTLTKDYGKSPTEANQLIETYRKNLRERKLALDIQIMQTEYANDNQNKRLSLLIWSVRLLVVLVAFLLIWVLTT